MITITGWNVKKKNQVMPVLFHTALRFGKIKLILFCFLFPERYRFVFCAPLRLPEGLSLAPSCRHNFGTISPARTLLLHIHACGGDSSEELVRPQLSPLAHRLDGDGVNRSRPLPLSSLFAAKSGQSTARHKNRQRSLAIPWPRTHLR